MRTLLTAPLAVLLAVTLASPILGQEAAADFDDKVEASRQKGVDFLVSQQQADGSWLYEKHEVGITALCTLALVENGLSPTDDVIKKGVDYVRDNCKELTSTYDIALSIVLLSTIGSRKDSDRIKGLAASLLAGQTTSGGWTYSCPKGNKSMLTNRRGWPKRKNHPGDNSCTQFAVLGLWVASREGIDIDNAMVGVARRFVYYQNEDGGWGYRLPTDAAANDNENPDDNAAGGDGKVVAEPSRNSMTFAGLFCLTVARATKIRAEKEEAERGRRATPEESMEEEIVVGEGEKPFEDAGSQAKTLVEDPIFEKGLEKAGAYANGINNGSAKYFLWSAERIGVMLGMEEIRGVDWFQKSASAMINTQQGDGSWGGGHGGPESNTAFCILVLRKANLGSDITRLLEGEPEQPFGIVGSEDRFDELAEAIEAAEEGAIIRVEGDGPFKLPHLDIEKDLTIQAGFGYTPKFEYDVGYDKFGVRTRPDRDPLTRCMFRAAGGTLTLEGLKLEMDPPFSTQKDLDWTGVLVDGGNLRMLNCVVTESNKRGVVAVRFMKAGTHELVNCALSTTVSDIYVHGSGVTDLLLENCILFGDIGIDLRQDPKAETDSRARINVTGSTIQTREAFRFLTLPTFPIEITFEQNVVQAEEFMTYLAPAGKGTPNTFTSVGGNIYDVDAWISVRRKSVSSVKDLRSWQAFWDHEEESSYDRIAGFTVRRPLASFSHRLRPEDWELTEERYESGVYALTVGTGRGFSRFRSTIQYNRWQDGESATIASR